VGLGNRWLVALFFKHRRKDAADKFSASFRSGSGALSDIGVPSLGEDSMDELTPEQEQAVAATVGAIQRIAMAVVELPQEQRERHYALVRRNFEAAITEFGIEGATAHAWLNSTMIGIQSLVAEIEAGGGAAGGNG
jgi:hypothetical protein